jgi:hypothetical protein
LINNQIVATYTDKKSAQGDEYLKSSDLKQTTEMLLSGLLSRYLATGNGKAMDLLRRISPAAWQHLHFLGHYAFLDKRILIDLEAILSKIDCELQAV